MSVRALVVSTTLGLCGVASAAGPTCTPFDRTPPCCRHAAPKCCEPALVAPLDDATVAQVCGGGEVKGQQAALEMCKHYYGRGDGIGEVDFGRQAGDKAAFVRLRASLAGARAKVLPGSNGPDSFVVHETDENGVPSRSSAWALVGGEIIHVEAEPNVCNAAQVDTLLQRALATLRTKQ